MHRWASTHDEAEEEADFGHISDGELAHGAQHALVVFGGWVGHARQLGLQRLSGRQLTHLHDVTKANPLLLGGCWGGRDGERGEEEKGLISNAPAKQWRYCIC